jgi:hypothetical protein
MDDRLLALAEDIAYERNEPPLTRELMDLGGGRGGFIHSLRAWRSLTRDGPRSCYIAPDYDYRKPLETLARTGVAKRGRAVPLPVRLEALPWETLRKAAKALRVGPVRSRDHAATVLAGTEGIEEWLAAKFDVDGFFYLEPGPEAFRVMERAWHGYLYDAERRLEAERGAS